MSNIQSCIYEGIEFIYGELRLNISTVPSEETVWSTVDQMNELINKNKSTFLGIFPIYLLKTN